ncbi:polysaccharide pyruvyl transferase family protein [Salimicrobium sp. PL1-032A]|uniref:polysaccharide pyruvyl transferase family protein n=1 Tax=Salimicrobium sp. PL1-032A TaxID=3095364 RepID=UPI0032612D37
MGYRADQACAEGSGWSDQRRRESVPGCDRAGTVLYYTFVIKLARFYNLPVYLYSQGVGPLHTSFARFAVRSALKHVEGSVRDAESRDLLRDIGVRKDFPVIPDPVLEQYIRTEDEDDWISSQGIPSPVITVSLRDWNGSDHYKKSLAATLDHFSTKGYAIVFVSMHGSPDSQVAEEVSHLMEEKAWISPSFLSLRAKATIIARSELLIGMRLHSLIFAANAEVPFAALSYDPKIDAFARELDQPLLGNINDKKETWDVDKMTSTLEYLLGRADYDEYCDKIGMMTKAATRTAESALRYFRHHI